MAVIVWHARLVAVLALVAVASIPALAQETSPLVTLDGDAVASDLASGDLIAVFFASWSPRCRGVVEEANSLHARWGSRAKIVLVAFQEDAGEVENFLTGKSLRVQVLRDPRGSFAKKYGVTTLPSLLVVKNGVTAFSGRFPADPNSILAPIFD
jgi:thiol-disulfide isomerase/thioredoxin